VHYSGYPALALRVGALRLPINIVPDDIVSSSATSHRDVVSADFAGAKICLSKSDLTLIRSVELNRARILTETIHDDNGFRH